MVFKNKTKKPNKITGFSLIETLIYLAILSLIMATLAPTLFTLESLKIRARNSGIEISDRMFVDSHLKNLLNRQETIIQPAENAKSKELKIRVKGNLVFTVHQRTEAEFAESGLVLIEDSDEPQGLHSQSLKIKDFNLERQSNFDIFEIIKYRYESNSELSNFFGTTSKSFLIQSD